MRNLLYILLVGLSCSCGDLLDAKSEISATYDNFFETEKDLEAITTQTHFYLSYALCFNVQAWLGEYADYYSPEIRQFRDLSPTSYSNTLPTMSWRDVYDMIYMTNVMLDNIDKAKEVAPDRIRYHRGQAHFAKGMGYFDLARRWGDAVITRNSTYTGKYGKRPAMEVLDTAIANARAAYRLLPIFEEMIPMSGSAVKSKQFGCKGAAAALLAHAFAWKGSMLDLHGANNGISARACYDSAVYYCSQLIGKEVGFYELEDSPELLVTQSLQGTLAGTAKECIFEFDTDYKVKWNLASCFVPAYTQGFIAYPVKYGYPMSFDRDAFGLEEGFNMSCLIKNSTAREMYGDGDLRRDAYFYRFEEMESLDEETTANCAYFYKWREQDVEATEYGYEGLTLKSNYVYWRLADIYLLRAECYLKNGNVPAATGDLKTIRERAQAESYPANGENDLKLAIFKEREKELLGEGHRFYDVIRNGYWETAFIKGNTRKGFAGLTKQDVRDGALYLPVGMEAFTNNDQMTQNRYWVKFLQ